MRTQATRLGVVSGFFAAVSGVALVALVLLTVVDVALRALFSSPLPWTVPYSEVVLVALVALGLGYAERENAHVSVEILTSRLSPRWERRLGSIRVVIVSGFLIWAVAATSQKALHAMQVRETRTGLVTVPVWPVRLVIPFGLGLMTLQLIEREWRKHKQGRDRITSSSDGDRS